MDAEAKKSGVPDWALVSPAVASLYVLITGTGRDGTDAATGTEGAGTVGSDGDGSNLDESMKSADALAVSGPAGESSGVDTAFLGDMARDTNLAASADTQPESAQNSEVLVDGLPYCLTSGLSTVPTRIFVPTGTCSDGSGSTE